jgi:hypothetical protein
MDGLLIAAFVSCAIAGDKKRLGKTGSVTTKTIHPNGKGTSTTHYTRAATSALSMVYLC